MANSKLVAYWTQNPLCTKGARERFDFIRKLESAFDLSPDPSQSPQKGSFFHQEIESSFIRLPKLVADLFNSKVYCPIEFFQPNFRWDSKPSYQMFQGKAVCRTFLSSGTTTIHSTRQRAVSHFSEDGLELYKAAAIKTFASVLKELFGENYIDAEGVSLIPKASERLDSSLSQMLSWFGEIWSVKSLSTDQATQFFSKKFQESMGKKPYWVFGTAIQFLQMIDEGMMVSLPKKAVLFETGGFKGTKREISQDELYQKMCSHFEVSSECIASEYSMAELACQAYRWWRPQPDFVGFRFPSWTTLGVMEGLGVSKSGGAGALIVQDPMRIDYPWPIRTQDVVTLNQGDLFSLDGRVPGAVLKGCSLGVEDVIEKEKNDEVVVQPRIAIPLKSREIPKEDIKGRISFFHPKWLSFLADEMTLKLLCREFGSESAARFAVKDIMRSLPDSEDGWYQAVLGSLAESIEEKRLRSTNTVVKTRVPRGWFFVLPSNHSLAGLYPMVMGFLAGLSMHVRVPEIFSKGSFLCEVVSFLNSLEKSLKSSQLALVPHCFRVGKNTLPHAVEAILCFGDKKTVSELKLISPVPVNGFGTSLAVSLFKAASIDDEAPLIIKDAFSLGQRGCLSSRLAFCAFDGDVRTSAFEIVERNLRRAAHKFWGVPFEVKTRLALDHETLQWKREGVFFSDRVSLDDPLFPIIDFATRPIDEGSGILGDIRGLLSSRPFVLPIIAFKSEGIAEILSVMRALPELKTISVSKAMEYPVRNSLGDQQCTICLLGEANCFPWDGFHEKTPLFFTGLSEKNSPRT